MAYSTSTYDAQLAAKDIDIINTKNTLKYNEESLRILKNGTTKEEIILAKNSIAAQKLSLEKVKKNLTKYQLEAPFDGTIRKIDFQIGDNILSDEEKYVYIENPNLLEITATVDQLEVVKLKIGQYSKIIFDAYPLLTFTGTVSDINSTPTQTSGVTSYTIKIAMDKGSNSIFSGMSAKVDIIIEAKENVLIIGTSFIEKRNGKAIILKKNGATDNRIEVVTGISNPTNTGTGSSTRSSIIPTGGGTRNSSSSNTRNGGD
jgi:multidrug efflux pump subunit AcrA (membrane-fusion protein)